MDILDLEVINVELSNSNFSNKNMTSYKTEKKLDITRLVKKVAYSGWSRPGGSNSKQIRPWYFVHIECTLFHNHCLHGLLMGGSQLYLYSYCLKLFTLLL
jgi:hypothetical protein